MGLIDWAVNRSVSGARPTRIARGRRSAFPLGFQMTAVVEHVGRSIDRTRATRHSAKVRASSAAIDRARLHGSARPLRS
jgi:hypothetical protein